MSQILLYSSIAWRDPLGWSRILEWAERHGWDGFDARGLTLDSPGHTEPRLRAFGYDMLGPRNIRPSARRELRRRFEAAGKRLSGIYCSASVNLPGSIGEEFRDLFREYLYLGADLGVDWIRPINNTTATHEASTMTESDAYRRTVDGLLKIAPLARELGIGLLLENNENTVTPDAESLLRQKSDLGDACRVGICYDPVNAYFQGHDPAAGFATLAGRIDVLHVKNVRRHTETRWEYLPRGDFSYEWTGLADGDLDWRSLLSLAADGGFEGPVVFEYVNPFKGMPARYWDTLREPEQAAEIESRFLRSALTTTNH